jgi:hypothetical protein
MKDRRARPPVTGNGRGVGPAGEARAVRLASGREESCREAKCGTPQASSVGPPGPGRYGCDQSVHPTFLPGREGAGAGKSEP